MLEFATKVDIGARACQHCGDFRLYSFDDESRQAQEIAFCYDKLRLAELQRNVWRFATRRAVLRPIDITTMLLVPATWAATGVYIPGSVVAYSGAIFICQGYPAAGVTPDTPPMWTPYFGPMTISQWQSSTNETIGTSYFAGELVYTPTSEGFSIYLALNNTTDVPGVYPEWDSSAVYLRGQTVQIGGGQLLFTPGNLPVFFTPGDLPVEGVLGLFQSVLDLNVGNEPSIDAPSQWQVVPAPNQPDYRTGNNWLKLDAGLQSIVISYPLGTGPVTDTQTRNIYKLPNAYLRHAPDQVNPNQIMRVMGVVSAAPSDAQFENGYMVTSEVKAVMLRFVVDMTDVTQMDDLFCEGLSARIALDVGPSIVPKEERAAMLARINMRYKAVIADARAVDAVERGASAQPQSQYMSVRF